MYNYIRKNIANTIIIVVKYILEYLLGYDLFIAHVGDSETSEYPIRRYYFDVTTRICQVPLTVIYDTKTVLSPETYKEFIEHLKLEIE